jgi:hypothetical protein
MQSPAEGEIAGVAQILITVVVALVAGPLLVLWAVVKRPLLAIPAVLFVGLVMLVGGHDALALLLWALLSLGVWRLVHKRSFERLVGRRMRSVWVRWWVYGRRWKGTMAMSGLTKRYRLREHTPRIRRVMSSPWCDRVQEYRDEGLPETAATIVHAWLADPAGETCQCCGATDTEREAS